MKRTKTILYFFAFILLFSSFFSCTNEKISLTEQPIDKELLPIFIVPEVDYNNKNEIIAISVFFHKNLEKDKLIEFTVLFKDEDHPKALVNFFYDIYRYFKYKRIIDTETFFIHYIMTDDAKWYIEYVDFPDDFSGNQSFYEKNVKHFSSKIEGINFERSDDRVIIYINTWNHMFSNKDTNPKLEKKKVDSYKTYFGDRKTVESQFSKKK